MKIKYNDIEVTIERMQDSTHVLWNGTPMHVGQIRNKELSNDLYEWLSNILPTEEIEKRYYYHNFICGTI